MSDEAKGLQAQGEGSRDLRFRAYRLQDVGFRGFNAIGGRVFWFDLEGLQVRGC